MSAPKLKQGSRSRKLDLARVLVVDDDVASRLTLQILLQAGGYRVDVAASAAEAVGKMDEHQYELVLSDLQTESPQAGLAVLAHAHGKDYKPATALITADCNPALSRSSQQSVFVEPEDVPSLLGKVAELIGQRAVRQAGHAAGDWVIRDG